MSKEIILEERNRSSRPEVFLRKSVLKICSKFTGEHPCRGVISIELQGKFIEIALRHGCFPVNLLHIFRTTFSRNTSLWLLLFPSLFLSVHWIQVKEFFNIKAQFLGVNIYLKKMKKYILKNIIDVFYHTLINMAFLQ